jgi:hypothetical protein
MHGEACAQSSTCRLHHINVHGDWECLTLPRLYHRQLRQTGVVAWCVHIGMLMVRLQPTDHCSIDRHFSSDVFDGSIDWRSVAGWKIALLKHAMLVVLGRADHSSTNALSTLHSLVVQTSWG